MLAFVTILLLSASYTADTDQNDKLEYDKLAKVADKIYRENAITLGKPSLTLSRGSDPREATGLTHGIGYVRWPSWYNGESGLKEKDVAYLQILESILIARLYADEIKSPDNIQFMKPYFKKHESAARELTDYINQKNKTGKEIKKELEDKTISIEGLNSIRDGLKELAKARGWKYAECSPAAMPAPISILSKPGDKVSYVPLASHWLMEMKGVAVDKYDWVACDPAQKTRLMGKYYFKVIRDGKIYYYIVDVPSGVSQIDFSK